MELGMSALFVPTLMRLGFIVVFAVGLGLSVTRLKHQHLQASKLVTLGLGLGLFAELLSVLLLWVSPFTVEALRDPPLSWVHSLGNGLTYLLFLAAWIVVLMGAFAGREE